MDASAAITETTGHAAAVAFNLRRLDLVSVQLAVYCAVYGSLSQAARKSNLSVSGASHRLKELERTLGHPLFERHRRGLALTPAGRVSVGHCARVLFSAQGLIASARAAGHVPVSGFHNSVDDVARAMLVKAPMNAPRDWRWPKGGPT